MEKFNKEQKMAISKVLLDIVSVDRKIDSREIAYLEEVKRKLALGSDDQYQVINLNTLNCLGVIKTMDEEQKLAFADMMRQIILADEYIDPYEARAFYDICEFIHVTGVGLA